MTARAFLYLLIVFQSREKGSHEKGATIAHPVMNGLT